MVLYIIMRHCFAGEIKTFLVPDPATYTHALKEVINGIFRETFLWISFGLKNQFHGTKPPWVMTLYR